MVTEKLQITLPKAVATQLGVKPGTELAVEATGEVIRLRPLRPEKSVGDVAALLRDFDLATTRQQEPNHIHQTTAAELFEAPARGWSREELYERDVRR